MLVQAGRLHGLARPPAFCAEAPHRCADGACMRRPIRLWGYLGRQTPVCPPLLLRCPDACDYGVCTAYPTRKPVCGKSMAVHPHARPNTLPLTALPCIPPALQRETWRRSRSMSTPRRRGRWALRRWRRARRRGRQRRAPGAAGSRSRHSCGWRPLGPLAGRRSCSCGSGEWAAAAAGAEAMEGRAAGRRVHTAVRRLHSGEARRQRQALHAPSRRCRAPG
jgi:hypothetical protein